MIWSLPPNLDRRKSRKLLKTISKLRMARSHSLGKGKEEISTCAHTLTSSTMPKTCVITATIEKVRPRWPMPVDTQTSLTTPAECVRTAILPSTTSRRRVLRKLRLIKPISI